MAKLAGIIAPIVSEVLLSGPPGSGATYRATGVSMLAFLIGAAAATALPIETKGRGMQAMLLAGPPTTHQPWFG